MDVQKNRSIWREGEQAACDFLLSCGHRILDRNWRAGHLELDIVSEAPDGVHFVEVKARTAPSGTSLPEQVDSLKQKRISAAALRYLHQKHIDGGEVFFDVVSVLFDGAGAIVRYFPQAWIPLYY